ncbi:hypothetical protein ACFOOL_05705 [Devosia honganensis]|uniref:Uncharacterized protein n=1 Tax=Devosia honganensis TaxID=1610527 RepID=A0ABV7WY93_9HYPH
MSQKLRIVVEAVPHGPWSGLADHIEATGAEVLAVSGDEGPIEFPAGWVPDGLVTVPAQHQRARFDQIDLDRWDTAAQEELDRRFHIAQAVARRMLEGDGGSLVHLVAAEGLPGLAGAGSAASLSYAVAGLSRGIALDLRDRVRSNVIVAEPDAAGLVAAVTLALHLCGAQGRGVSGQIAAIDAENLRLFSQSRPVRIAHRDGGWDEASLAAQIGRWASCLPRLEDMEGVTQ